MIQAATVVLIFLLSFSAFGQQPRSGKKKPEARKPAASKPAPAPEKERSEKEEFEKAVAVTDIEERISALKGFTVNFPESPNRVSALELLAAARAVYAEGKMQAGEPDTAVIVFRQTADEAPAPVPQKLFTETIYKIPATLYWRGQRVAALEIAKIIEGKVGDNAAQLIDLATFYLGIEAGEDAKRLTEKAVQLDPKSAPAYQALGQACRLNFQLEESAQAYAKALEIEPDSITARRSLAEMKRAIGNSAEAASLYREILSKDETNSPARTGLVLSLFDAGKISEAESEMARSLEQNPNDVVLLAGAAYWYAANGQSDKAAELAQKAVASEPRYIWSHIALARGLIGQNKPLEAERVLLSARQYGNFPTLEYEIAAARLTAGFYREAAEELKKSFSIKDGVITTRLGGRIPKEGKSFIDLLSAERRASIFAPSAADNATQSMQLKSLLELSEAVASADSNEADAVRAVDEFVAGDDSMKLHRQLYAAETLVKKKIALPKVLELTLAAIGKADAALKVPVPAATIMASELYESRSLALSRGEVIRVPDVPLQTLSAIFRGRVEEITGWALYHQGSNEEAVVRLKRAVSVLPEKSAWWRSSMWKLGAALEAGGKEKEALDFYIKSYVTDKPDLVKYLTVERLYRKIHGGTDGLEAKIGPNPLPVVAVEKIETPKEPVAQKIEPPQPTAVEPKPTPVVEDPEKVRAAGEAEKDAVKVEQSPKVEPSPSPTPEKEPEVVETPSSTPEVVPVPSPMRIEPPPIAETPAPTPEAVPTPIPTPETQAEAAAAPSPTPEKPPDVTATPLQTPEPTPTAVRDTNQASVKAAEPILPVETTETKPDAPAPSKTDEPASASAKPPTTKPLFDPVIITITRAGTSSEKKPAAEQPRPEEPAKNDAQESAPEQAAKKRTDDAVGSGETRKRIVEEKPDTEDAPKCEISVSQDSISLLNNGGKLGLLVGVEGAGDIKTVKALTGSPQDVEVTLEPEIAGVTGRAFYVIKSISPNTGTFKVTFEAPCGRKDVTVTVR